MKVFIRTPRWRVMAECRHSFQWSSVLPRRAGVYCGVLLRASKTASVGDGARKATSAIHFILGITPKTPGVNQQSIMDKPESIDPT
jgi:hypothetical protein